MKLPVNARIVSDDRLAIVWRMPNGDCRAKGKRVGKDCPLTLAERRHYVTILGRPAQFTKYLMDTRGLSFAAAWKLLKAAR